MNKSLLACVFALWACGSNAIAGSRDGYYALFVEGEDVPQYLVKDIKYFFDARYNNKIRGCLDKENINFEKTYIKRRPVGIDRNLAFSVLSGNKNSEKKFRNIISSYRDEYLNNGFDFGVVYAYGENLARFVLLTPYYGDPIRTFYVNAPAGRLNINYFEQKLCFVMKNVPYAYGP